MNVNLAVSRRATRRSLAIRKANAAVTDAAWYDAKYAAEKANFASHRFGIVDDCERCLVCEIGIWNGRKEFCV